MTDKQADTGEKSENNNEQEWKKKQEDRDLDKHPQEWSVSAI